MLLSIFADISLFSSLPVHALVSVSGLDDDIPHRYIKSKGRVALPVIQSGSDQGRGGAAVRFDTVRGNPLLIDTVGSAFLSCPSCSSTIEVRYVMYWS
jgi:hypothetical protein